MSVSVTTASWVFALMVLVAVALLARMVQRVWDRLRRAERMLAGLDIRGDGVAQASADSQRSVREALREIRADQ